MTSEIIENNLDITESYSWEQYLNQVKRHINKNLSDNMIESVRESYMADYPVHECITQLDLV